MHPNQIETSPELVRKLLTQQYPALASEQIADKPLHGTDSDTYRVGRHHAVRLPIIEWALGKQEHIRPWLPWIAARITTPVPVPVYYGSPGCGYEHDWTIYPWIPGRTMSMGCDDPEVAKSIAGFLGEIRDIPIDGAPSAGRSPHALDKNVRDCLAQLLQEDRRDELIAIWDHMMTTPPWDGAGKVWMHGDIAPGNLLFEHGRFVAAIDWTEIGVGDPASDLQVAWNMLGATARQVLKAEMDVDDEVWFRARSRAFAQASFQLPYYRETNKPLAAQAKYVFGQILEEYS